MSVVTNAALWSAGVYTVRIGIAVCTVPGALPASLAIQPICLLGLHVSMPSIACSYACALPTHQTDTPDVNEKTGHAGVIKHHEPRRLPRAPWWCVFGQAVCPVWRSTLCYQRKLLAITAFAADLCSHVAVQTS